MKGMAGRQRGLGKQVSELKGTLGSYGRFGVGLFVDDCLCEGLVL